jgi:hypothetical protein
MASLSIGDSALTYFGLAAHESHHVSRGHPASRPPSCGAARRAG